MSEPTMTVIIPVRDGGAHIGNVLDALSRQDVAPDQVIVVDNGSADDSVRIARSHPLVPLVITEPEVGSYRARNTGAAHATTDALAFTDVDCVPSRHWIAEGCAALGKAALVGGSVIADLGSNPTPWSNYDAFFYLRQEDNIHNGFAATANLFVMRDVFERVHGFDARFMSGGDHDFAVRAIQSGATLAYAPQASVRHVCRGSMRDVWKLQTRIGAGWGALRAAGRRPPLWRDPGHREPFKEFERFVPNDVDPTLRRQLHLIHYLVIGARLYGQTRYVVAHRLNRGGSA